MAEDMWIGGFHAIEAALDRHPERLRQVAVVAGRDDKRVRRLCKLAASAGVAVVEHPDDWFARLTSGGRPLRHQGVAARMTLRPAGDEAELGDLLSAATETPLLLVLDGVTDPHNLGACLRGAEAAGALAVIAPKDRACGLTPAARKTSAGSSERLPFIQVTNLARTLADLKQQGVWIVGTAGSGPVSLYECDFAREPVAVVMGAEGSGLRRLTQDRCDQLIHIPMASGVESLNVSVASAVCLFEFRRQRLAGG
ncbi:23S rRNA (guanosine(2251)-2'-O)-methyltransferase RlmB [Guyparkeria sp.]|uniref:23S rRNA (guanosine(2251)-2'-O)-methyltransferase RlmB n=1 Tax=Guyparkeria sp. TaxID=2035736 RepID=UPI0035679926